MWHGGGFIVELLTGAIGGGEGGERGEGGESLAWSRPGFLRAECHLCVLLC